jgi:protein TonB
VSEQQLNQPLAGEAWVGDDVAQAKPKSDGVLMWLGGAQIIMILVGLFVVLAVVGGGYMLMHGKSSGGKKGPKISLIPMAPPPPPPPPKEEKKPEPPKEQKEVKEVPQAPPKNAPPAPPSQDLKMEGAAGTGPSAFGSGSVTNENQIPGSGGGGGGGVPEHNKDMFDAYGNYDNLTKGELQRFLARSKDLQQRAFKVKVHLWVTGSGALKRYEVVGSTGDTDLDETIRQALATLKELSTPPPENMPMPIRLRLTVSGR